MKTVIVGRATLDTPTTGLQAISPSFPDDGVATSDPTTGCASGTAPGHIGTCVCPGDDCQAGVCPFRPPNANITQRAEQAFEPRDPLLVHMQRNPVLRKNS
jgi:hypothetical protein